MSTHMSKLEITGTGLKLIAVITMLIDHIGAGILRRMLLTGGTTGFESIIGTYDLYSLTRAIGRMAFPIYCYLLVEGFIHTRNIGKYAMRLFIVAVISEIPFDYAIHDSYFYLEHNNVLWTLLLGLGVMYGFSLVEFSGLSFELQYILRIIIMFSGMALAYVTKLDYKHSGICCIAVMYYLYSNDRYKRLFSVSFGILILTLMSSKLELWAFFILIPMYFYQGNRGADSKALRTFFYLFYPIHLLILGIVAYLLF